MKVLTLWQPHASLCVIINPATGLPYKTIETRGWKPPKSLIGQRIALHAAASENWREGQRVGDWLCYRTSKTHRARMYCRVHSPMVVPLPLGATVGTVVLADVVPIVGSPMNAAEKAAADAAGYYLLRAVGGLGMEILGLFRVDGMGVHAVNNNAAEHPYAAACPWRDDTAQKPYGDFTLSTKRNRKIRFAWLLTDAEPVDPPVPFRGGQGLTKSWEPSSTLGACEA